MYTIIINNNNIINVIFRQKLIEIYCITENKIIKYKINYYRSNIKLIYNIIYFGKKTDWPKIKFKFKIFKMFFVCSNWSLNLNLSQYPLNSVYSTMYCDIRHLQRWNRVGYPTYTRPIFFLKILWCYAINFVPWITTTLATV